MCIRASASDKCSNAGRDKQWSRRGPAGSPRATPEKAEVYRRGSRDAASSDTGRLTDDDDDPKPAEDQIDDDDDADPEAVYRAMMRKAEGLAAERGITQAQAFEKLLVAREPELRRLVKCARAR